MTTKSIAILAAALFAAASLLTSAPAAAAAREIKITGNDQMQYSVKRIEAKPGESLKVVLTAVSSMPKAEMAHNFILLKKGANPDAFVMAGAMARNTEYVPAAKKDQILASTTLAGGGETVEVTFDAPAEPGEYVYLCSFPGHYAAGMKGLLVVK
ncbi:MAG: azu 1 [Acidobacteria bacterium]|jgi:azurin|nr:azu 1 [Acidobacteriota bacterium]